LRIYLQLVKPSPTNPLLQTQAFCLHVANWWHLRVEQRSDFLPKLPAGFVLFCVWCDSGVVVRIVTRSLGIVTIRWGLAVVEVVRIWSIRVAEGKAILGSGVIDGIRLSTTLGDIPFRYVCSWTFDCEGCFCTGAQTDMPSPTYPLAKKRSR
jgi:hypothetical protein